MKQLAPLHIGILALCAPLLMCKGDDGDGDDGDGTGSDASGTGGGSGTDDGGVDTSEPKFDAGVGGGCADADGGDCAGWIDLLFVIDNSGSMGEEQLNLARNFPLLIDKLENLVDAEGEPVNPNVNIMVTTTDFGNPLCVEEFYSEPRDPEQGAPITTGCNERLARFTFNSDPPKVREEACTQVCPTDVVPDDPFIHLDSSGDNVPDVGDNDIDGDGNPDSPVAQALACLGPVGIDGCGYESQLEAMHAALDPDADWNSGSAPFLRPGALVAIVVITDEADCSLADASVMNDESVMETRPDLGAKFPSSAICWNAGVTCDGPDANGEYTDCTSVSDDKLHPAAKYTDYLVNELRFNQGKDVMMLGILGVPLVTERNPDPPFEPTAGGVFDLVYRDWQDPEYPAGDILPDEWADGVTAENKQFDFGVGPGCTGEDGMGGFTGQAIPPVRIKEVCESLNFELPNGDPAVRCCIESICDTDFSFAIECLTGIISESIIPEG